MKANEIIKIISTVGDDVDVFISTFQDTPMGETPIYEEVIGFEIIGKKLTFIGDSHSETRGE